MRTETYYIGTMHSMGIPDTFEYSNNTMLIKGTSISVIFKGSEVKTHSYKIYNFENKIWDSFIFIDMYLEKKLITMELLERNIDDVLISREIAMELSK